MDWAQVDVAVPRRSRPLPGISMAGFRQNVPALVDIAMVAHPSVTLVVDLTEGDGLVYDAHGQHQRGSFVAGLLPGQLRAGGWRGECLQIRLSPVVAATVLGVSAELTGTVAALEDVWGRDARQVEDRLRAAMSWDERFTIAADVLGRRLRARPPADPEVAHTWRRTLTSSGRVRVDGLADEVGWSRKRLWSRFRFQLGITPKCAAQLVRFDYAAHLLAAGHATPTSPTFTARSRRSPGSRPRAWPPRRGSRSTPLHGLLHREPDTGHLQPGPLSGRRGTA